VLLSPPPQLVSSNHYNIEETAGIAYIVGPNSRFRRRSCCVCVNSYQEDPSLVSTWPYYIAISLVHLSVHNHLDISSTSQLTRPSSPLLATPYFEGEPSILALSNPRVSVAALVNP